jgi:hypothetical protein
MSALGEFLTKEHSLTDGSKVYDVVFHERYRGEITIVNVYEAADQTDASMVCERLNAAIATKWMECSECNAAFGHMPSCPKHRNAALKRGA